MRSLQRSMCAAMLSLQSVVLLLTTPVMIAVGDVRTWVAVLVGVGLAVACLLVAGMLRRPWAYVLGWGIQAASVALGLVVPIMFFLGTIFLALWAAAYLMGARIDQERAGRV